MRPRVGGRIAYKKAGGELVGVKEMLLDSTVVVFEWYTENIHFIVCKLYLSVIDLRPKPKIELVVVHHFVQLITSFCEGL